MWCRKTIASRGKPRKGKIYGRYIDLVTWTRLSFVSAGGPIFLGVAGSHSDTSYPSLWIKLLDLPLCINKSCFLPQRGSWGVPFINSIQGAALISFLSRTLRSSLAPSLVPAGTVELVAWRWTFLVSSGAWAPSSRSTFWEFYQQINAAQGYELHKHVYVHALQRPHLESNPIFILFDYRLKVTDE